MKASSPFVARLGAALGLDGNHVRVLVDRIARHAGDWLPCRDDVDVAVMCAQMGFPGRPAGELADALERAWIIASDGNGRNYRIDPRFIDVVQQETERRAADRERKRADRARTVLETSGQRAENEPSSRARATSTSSSSTTTTPSAGDISDRDWVRSRASAHGVVLSPHMLNLLLDYLLAHRDADADIEQLLCYAGGARNKVAYIRNTLPKLESQRRRDLEAGSRAPPGPWDEIDPDEFGPPSNVRFIGDRRQ